MLRRTIFISSILSAFMFSACTVDKEENTELPEVDVEVEDGNLPTYDVNWADVDVSTRKKMVEVPKVMVVMEEEEVEVPYVDFDMPDSQGMEKGEEVISVEVQVQNESREINISEVYLHNNKLIVVSQLENTGTSLDDKRVQVSDQMIVNLPKEKSMKVVHYVIGENPSSNRNSGYNFIGSKSEISNVLNNANQII